MSSSPTATVPDRAVGDADPRCLAGEEFPLSAECFARIAAILRDEAGIVLGENKTALVRSRLGKRLRSLRLRSFREYCALLDGPDGAAERRETTAALTTNVTRFFREPHHFEHLRRTVLPPLLERARRGDRLRLWSAAASSGEEAYSIGMEVLQLMPDAADHDVRVLATDIDPNVLATGRNGCYPVAALAPVPAEPRRRWFGAADAEPGTLRAGDALRRLVTFRELNLNGSWPALRCFHAVFCRNVAIYFGETTQARLWSRLATLIEPDGMLYIGHSERIAGEAAACFRSEGITSYRRIATGSAGDGAHTGARASAGAGR